MEKISSFKITELSVSGFKNFTGERMFKFGDMNTISGHNGQGKTGIADAIAYAITGVPFFGGEKSLDRLYAIGCEKDMKISLSIKLENGSLHRLVRSRVNDNTYITFDDAPVCQNDLTLMFGDKDIFLSIFNPLYFIEVLGNSGRNLLQRCLPSVPNETVMARVGDDYRGLLEKAKMNSPEALLEKLRADIRELEKDIIYFVGTSRENFTCR